MDQRVKLMLATNKLDEKKKKDYPPVATLQLLSLERENKIFLHSMNDFTFVSCNMLTYLFGYLMFDKY